MSSLTWLTRPRLLRLYGLVPKRFEYGARYGSTTTISFPSLPPRLSTSGPLPWLSLRQIDEYLKPLRTHIPWTFTTSNTTSRATGSRRKVGPGWSYHGKYIFRAREFGLQFVARVRDVLNDEGIPYSALQSTDFVLDISSKSNQDHDHDAPPSPKFMLAHRSGSDVRSLPELSFKDIYIDQPKLEMVMDDETVVSLKIKTHHAYIPEEILSLRPQLPATKATPFPSTLTVPGLTIRDVRFAMLIDQIFREEYLETGRGLKFRQLPSLVYPSAQQMASNIFRQGFCRCCGLPHQLHECNKRKEYPPVGRCNVCGGSHWVVDCLVVRNLKARGRR